MSRAETTHRPNRRSLPKAATGIEGLDEVTLGGLPRGRPTLICGGAGSAKTLLATEFLVRGATEFGEPGVFMAFEETSARPTTASKPWRRPRRFDPTWCCWTSGCRS